MYVQYGSKLNKFHDHKLELNRKRGHFRFKELKSINVQINDYDIDFSQAFEEDILQEAIKQVWFPRILWIQLG